MRTRLGLTSRYEAIGVATGILSMNGKQSYVEGVAGGQAVRLAPQQSVSTNNKTNHLRGRSATVEFFFKQVRYIVGVKSDLSALIYRNSHATVQTTIQLPTDQPIEVGRWYHFAMTSFDLDLRAYVDGHECILTGGAFEFTRRGPKQAPMTFGGTKAKGWSEGDILLDEVACYASGLAEADFQSHLKAAGWQQRLDETSPIVRSPAIIKKKKLTIRFWPCVRKPKAPHRSCEHYRPQPLDRSRRCRR